jgi:hypothetical protein
MFKTVHQMVMQSQAVQKQNNLNKLYQFWEADSSGLEDAAMYVGEMLLSITTMYLIGEYSCYEEANRHEAANTRQGAKRYSTNFTK